MAFLCRERAWRSTWKAQNKVHLAGGNQVKLKPLALHYVLFGQMSRAQALHALTDALDDGPLPSPARATEYLGPFSLPLPF